MRFIMSETGRKTIKKEIFISSMIFSSIIMIIFGLFMSSILYRSGKLKASEIIKQRNYAVNFFINGYFSEINNMIEILAANQNVQDLPWLGASERHQVLKLYKTFLELNKNITYIYSAYEINKELLINDYTPPEVYDPTVRPWYKDAIAAKPASSTGEPYQDIISNEWLFATGKVLVSKKYGFSGVVSSDSSIKKIIILLKQREGPFKSSYSFVANKDGKILIHPNGAYLKKYMSEIFDSPIDLNKREGLVHYKLSNKEKIAYYSRCLATDWLIVTVVEKDEITSSIIWQIFSCLIFMSFIAVLLGVGQSIMLSRRFSTPLIELRKRVKSIIHGNSATASDYKYPENEIGIIAREIGQLTAHEFYVRSQKLEALNLLLEQKNVELKILSSTDKLTGIWNRQKIDIELEKEIQRSTRYKNKFSVIMFDIDWFKKINDTHGHQAGDSVLKEISLLLKNNTRPMDVLGRWGGEEFMILCPETDLKNAQILGNRICSSVAKHQFTINTQVTISVGVTEFLTQEKPDDLIKRVDDNLYTAKHQGKNIVVAV